MTMTPSNLPFLSSKITNLRIFEIIKFYTHTYMSKISSVQPM